MAVHYTGGGGGFFDSLMQAAQMASMVIPGMQPYAMALNAAGQLANGNVGGALGMVGGKLAADGMERTQVANARNNANRQSLNGGLMDMHRQNFDSTVPMDQLGAEANRGSLSQAFMDAAVPMAGDASGGSWTRAHRQNAPGWNTDPVTGERQLRRKPWEV